jgi:hypothetical protein
MNAKRLVIFLAAACVLALVSSAQAVTNNFFNASQTMTIVSSNMTDITISSGGYLFTYSQDGYFTGGVGMTNPVGRFFSVVWPNGVQAQAITVQPPPPTPPAPSGANITITRVDGKLFDLQSFTGKILLNTAGAGGAFEVTPQLNGNDALGSPFQYDCTGYAGTSFPYATAFVGYDTYQIHMWGDFALTQLTLVDASLPPPVLQMTRSSANSLQLTWPTNYSGCVLQQNASLRTTNWVGASEAVSNVGANYQVTITTTNGPRFFRLRQP